LPLRSTRRVWPTTEGSKAPKMSTRRKAPSRIAPPATRPNARAQIKTTIDERNAAVSSSMSALAGRNEALAIEISSGSSSDLSEPEQEEIEIDDEHDLQLPNGQVSDVPIEKQNNKPLDARPADRNQLPSPEDSAARPEKDAEDEIESDAEGGPTFGELLRGHEMVDVTATGLEEEAGGQVVLANQSQVVSTPATSMSTVLNQALHTDDSELLEKCLREIHYNKVAETVRRMDSTLSVALLVKITSLLNKKPGRSGTLMAWVKIVLVLHGGYISSQPHLQKKLRPLQEVLRARAQCLTPLLELKGKLDLLVEQAAQRKTLGWNSTLEHGANDDEIIVSETALRVFKPGALPGRVPPPQPTRKKIHSPTTVQQIAGRKRRRGKKVSGRTKDNGEGAKDVDDMDVDGDGDEVVDVPLANGIGGDSDGDEVEEDVEHDEDEVEEEEAGNEDDGEVDHEDVDEESPADDDDSELEDARPTKVPRRR